MLTVFSLSAQYSPCYYEKFEQGKQLFYQHKYKEAKQSFINSKKCPDPNTAEANKWIKKCNDKINPPPPATPTTSTTPATSATPEIQAPQIKEYTVDGIAFNMVFVEGGTFTMGCTRDQCGCDKDEKPAHNVTLSDFWMGETEVTQAVWKAVMGTTVAQQRDKANSNWLLNSVGSNYPMYYVNYNEAVEFCNKLNSKIKNQLPSGWHFALPSEAQWEYAARGGKYKSPYKYSGSNNIDEVAWNRTTTEDDGTKPVKGAKPNALGLYDMTGNVWEWCLDWYSEDYYSVSASTNPVCLSEDSKHVMRGGSWLSRDSDCRIAVRMGIYPDGRYGENGFRLVLVRK